MELQFKREVVKDPQGKIKYRVFRSGGREHFNLRIWLDGPDNELDQVEKVTYELHPTFLSRYPSSTSRSEKFAISIWTWGMFLITATIEYKDGSEEIKQFYLKYELPIDNGTNYIKV